VSELSSELLVEIKRLAESITNEEIRSVVLSILENPSLTFTESKPLISLTESPAAPRKHHFYTGGLLVHTLSVAKVALALVEVFERVYGIKVDRDVVLAAAILHDIYKYYQYAPDPVAGGYRAREDWYLAHDYSLIAELSRRGAPDKLIRAASEVHGQAPFSTIEGFIVHLADSVDARAGEFIQNMLLTKARELEAYCNLFKAIDHLVKRLGARRVVEAALGDPDSYKQLVLEVCKAIQST
jgi:7,8-dihydroneopterin 2',3'-cyclic phosphate phosphodiesterase